VNRVRRGLVLMGSRLGEGCLSDAPVAVDKNLSSPSYQALVISWSGIVRTTWPWPPTGRRLRDVSDLVSPAPFPAECDSACGLALPALHPELSRCRGAACTACARPLLRERPELGAEIRPYDCSTACGCAVLGRAIAGISTRWWSGSPASGWLQPPRLPVYRPDRGLAVA
jgi:hypothetical protein